MARQNWTNKNYSPVLSNNFKLTTKTDSPKLVGCRSPITKVIITHHWFTWIYFFLRHLSLLPENMGMQRGTVRFVLTPGRVGAQRWSKTDKILCFEKIINYLRRFQTSSIFLLLSSVGTQLPHFLWCKKRKYAQESRKIDDAQRDWKFDKKGGERRRNLQFNVSGEDPIHFGDPCPLPQNLTIRSSHYNKSLSCAVDYVKVTHGL